MYIVVLTEKKNHTKSSGETKTFKEVYFLKNKLDILHTEKEKKQYGKLEKEIKCTLNELLLLSKAHLAADATSRGPSITKDFKVRELTKEENDKYLANPANIKRGTLEYNEIMVKKQLFDMLERNIKDDIILQKYKDGIEYFFKEYLTKPRLEYINSHPVLKNFLQKKHTDYKNGIISLEVFNVTIKVAMILQERLGDNAFSVAEKDGLEIAEISPKSLQYIQSIFTNVNAVRKEWGGDLNQVFHDGDFPFITNNEKKNFDSYVKVLIYLLSHKKHNPSGKGGNQGDLEWTKKTGQYADMLWACTDPALELHTDEALSRDNSTFRWSEVTRKTFEEAEKLLRIEVKTYNERHGTNFLVTARLKSISSCLEKIIEGKRLNDIMGFRVSMEDANTTHFRDIQEIGENWLTRLKVNMEGIIPDKSFGEENIHGFLIKSVAFDNKGVLNNEQIDTMKHSLEGLLPQTNIYKRVPKDNPYIKKEEWTQLMKANYPVVYGDGEKWSILSRHYDNFSQGVVRGHNGSYKDFKENIACRYIDGDGEIREKIIELQFDDLENNIGLANYNIRNAERAINTASNSMFTKPLKQVTRTVETHLKKMANQVSGKGEKYTVIDFGNGVEQDISQFMCRDRINTGDMDKTIVEIINYFIKQGKFIFYTDAVQKTNKLPNGLLLSQTLHDPYIAENLHICSNLGLSKQQHSYLLSNWSDQIGIYMPETETIGWMKLWEILDYMNLGKKKFKDLAYIPAGIQTINPGEMTVPIEEDQLSDEE